MFKQRTTPDEYKRSALNMIAKFRRFKELWTAISRSSDFKDEDRQRFAQRRDWIDNEIATLWARCHFEDPEQVLRDRKIKVAQKMLDMFDILEEFDK